MANKRTKILSKIGTRKRRKIQRNDGMFGSKKRKHNIEDNEIIGTPTEHTPEPTSSSSLIELMPVEPNTLNMIMPNSENIVDQGSTVDKTVSDATSIYYEKSDESYIVLPAEEKPFEIVSGRRILDIEYFFNKLKQFANHSSLFDCGSQCLSLVGEKRVGLLSKFKFKCDLCGAFFYIDSEDPAQTDNVNANVGAVIGIVSAGVGYSQFEEIAASINVPIFTEKLFSKIQDDVYNEWEATAAEAMEAANERERQAAIAEGRVDKNGTALIDVYADGCWCARSYGNNYRALSGAAAIIGRRFGEVLFIAVKNKYCLVCARAQKKGLAAKEHICYKNYDGSSTGMEAEIICEGFKLSIEMYNVIYQRLIADGDSATYAKILATKPYPETTVTKIECRNHILRNLCNKIRAVAKDVKYPITFRKLLTDKKIFTVRKAVVCSIKENKRSVKGGEISARQGIENLHSDIQNSILHAFGDHRKCKDYYCDKDKDLLNAMELTNSSFWFRIKVIISAVASKSQSLLEDVDTNAAERFNSVVAKIVGGKRINFSTRRSYQARCAAAVVSYNSKLPKYTVQKKWIGKSPKSRLKKLEERRNKKREWNRRHPYKKNRTHNKNEKKIQNDYGQNCSAPDMSQNDFEKAKQEFLQNLKDLTCDRDQIQKDTILQRDCSDWLELRKNMVTASNFGRIVKKKKNTSCKNLVKTILYKKNLDHVASIAHGVENEKLALEQLAKQEEVIIEPCGLFVDSKYPFIGASPDGIIGEDTIVEVKCPITAYKKGIENAIKENKIQIYKYDKKKNTYCINNNSNWFYQIQGQLHVTQRKKCLFAIWAGENQKLKTEYIERDDNFWLKKMEEKLVTFYLECILPEIVDPRHTRGMAIRDSNEAQSNKENCAKNSEDIMTPTAQYVKSLRQDNIPTPVRLVETSLVRKLNFTEL